MPKSTRICKVCGIEYPYCKTENRQDRFRFQDVACCQEHGAIYFAEVLAARNKEKQLQNNSFISDADILLQDDEEDDEDDAFFEEDFDDDEEDDDADSI